MENSACPFVPILFSLELPLSDATYASLFSLCAYSLCMGLVHLLDVGLVRGGSFLCWPALISDCCSSTPSHVLFCGDFFLV